MPKTCFDWFNYWLWVGNTAAPVIVLIATPFVARYGWTRWRREQLTAKRAEAAAGALMASTRFVGAVIAACVGSNGRRELPPAETTADAASNVPAAEVPAEDTGTAPFVPSWERVKRQGAEWEAEFVDNWSELVGPAERAFNDACIVAADLLGDEVASLLNAIWAKKNRIKSSQHTHINQLLQGHRDQQSWNGGWGGELPSELKALLRDARGKLRLYLHMQK